MMIDVSTMKPSAILTSNLKTIRLKYIKTQRYIIKHIHFFPLEHSTLTSTLHFASHDISRYEIGGE